MRHFVMSGLAPYAMPIPYDEHDDMNRRDVPEFATIVITGTQSAQGTVLRRHRDGRVTIDAGGCRLTGRQADAVSLPKGNGWLARLFPRL